MNLKGVLLLGQSIDAIHAGAGRTPGVVDLTVQRDQLGYPLIYASSVKGALKHYCARSQNCLENGRVDERGRLRCDKCKECCCLFGGEPGEGDAGSSRITVTDLVPLAFPVASASKGFVYVTSPILIARALSLLELMETLRVKGDKGFVGVFRAFLKELYELSTDLKEGEVLSLGLGDSVDVAGIMLTVKASKTIKDLVKDVSVSEGKDGEKLLAERFESLGGLARMLPSRLVVASADDGALLIDKALVRVTRVALRRDRKTVMTGALWTEEYIPAGTVFVGGLLELDVKNNYCDKANIGSSALDYLLEKILAKNGDSAFYVFVAGKETLGKGLIKFLWFK